MSKNRTRTLAALVAAGALTALPAAAAASPVSAAATVAQYTDRADDALAKAGALFEAGKDRAALKSLNRSRADIGKATAAAAKMLRQADTPAERVTAAMSLRRVAFERDENVSELIKMLSETDVAGIEGRIATAMMADVTKRDTAIKVLQGLLEKGLPAKAEVAISKAIARLSTDRQEEVEEVAELVAEGEVSDKAARIATKAVDRSLRGQERAKATISALLETAPAAAHKGLQRALAAIGGEQQGAAAGLEAAAGKMPEWVRTMVDGMIRRAGTAGRPDQGPGSEAEVGTVAGPPAGLPIPSIPVNIPVSIPVDLSNPGAPVSVPTGSPVDVGGILSGLPIGGPRG